MSTLLSLDPGLNDPAIALFKEGVLVYASRVKVEKAWTKLNMAERCRQVAYRIAEVGTKQGFNITEMCTEYPQVYKLGKSKGNPNQLLPMVGILVGVASLLDVNVTSYLPAEWLSGQCPKAEEGNAWDSPRGRRIKEALSIKEIGSIILSHDALDATGVGLFHLGRFKPRRVYPGST
jgi:hypothetical protein